MKRIDGIYKIKGLVWVTNSAGNFKIPVFPHTPTFAYYEQLKNYVETNT